MKYSSIEDVLLSVLAILIIVILLWTIYSVIFAIIQFIFSNWDQDKIKKAWNSIRYTIIGIIITVFLLFFIPMIFQRISPTGSVNYSARSILNRAMVLGRNILSIWWLYSTPAVDSPRSIDWWNQINGPL